MLNMMGYTIRDLQHCLQILRAASLTSMSVADLVSEIELVVNHVTPIDHPRPAHRRRPDNVSTCPICGQPAVIVPLSRADRTPTATHAIQCQNRPAANQPWRDGMCGHTEYIVRGNK